MLKKRKNTSENFMTMTGQSSRRPSNRASGKTNEWCKCDSGRPHVRRRERKSREREGGMGKKKKK